MKNLKKLTFIILYFLLIVNFLATAQNSFNQWEENYTKGVYELNSKNHEIAKIHLEKAYHIAKESFDKNDENLLNTTYQLGALHYKTANFKSALTHYLEALKILEFNYGKNDKEYIALLNKLSLVYKKLGKFNNALECAKSYNELTKNTYGLNSDEHLKGINSLCQIYGDMGEYDVAIAMLKKSLLNQTKKDFTYIHTIFTLSYVYDGIGEYEKVIELLLEAKAISKESDWYYNDILSNLAETFGEIGDYKNNLNITLSVVQKTSKNDSDYPIRLLNLAYAYSDLGEYNKATINYDKAIASCLKIYGKEHQHYSKIIDAQGQHFFNQGYYERAKTLFEEALTSFLINHDQNHPQYGFYLNNYTNTLLALGKNQEAIRLMMENIKTSEVNNQTDSETYYRKQLALANAYNKIGDFNKALPILTTYSEKLKLKLGDSHLDYGTALKNLSNTYIGLNQLEKAITNIDFSNTIFISQIDKIFKFRSEKEKRSFLKTIHKNFDEIQSIAYNSPKHSKLLDDINLSNQIMLKGLLLNSSINLLSHLSSLQDNLIDNKIINYKSLKNKYTKTASLPFEERTINMDSLNEQINNREAELVTLYNSYFKGRNITSGDWKSSQSNLTANDIAIEFSHFNVTTNNKLTDSTMYVAYVYKAQWESPKMIPLFEEKQLKKIIFGKTPDEIYLSNKLYNLIWKPLEQIVVGNKTIYFSPSGLLNQISFSALKNDPSPTLSSQYNLVQLSNTGKLHRHLTEPKTTNTLFMGGIVYDYNKTVTDTLKPSFAYLNSEKIKKSRGTKSRGESWDYLEGTLQEIQSLQNLLESKQKISKSFSAENATESNLKKLSGNSPEILHIATHGFFFENQQKEKPLSQFGLSTEDQYRLADDPLLRSGLILAGANYAWKHGYNPNEKEDGILTALEISNLDFSNTSIVVLSACKTGLGDIDGSEGVYGLQRAFKMAGVDIIVMSLWQVPDEETAEFMNLFYTNWLNLNDVRKAFNKAQITMQVKHKNHPENWAAFVLFE